MRLVSAIPILLAVSFHAQSAQPNWIADSRTGCKVWNASPQPNESVSWSGDCKNGLAQGSGVLQWFINGKPDSRDEGEFKDGKLHGRAISIFHNGNRHEGEYKNHKRDGRGIMTYANGNRYEGEFKNGTFNGRGIFTFASGSRYEGDFENGTGNGRGVFTFADGGRYEGEYKAGKPNGMGTYYAGGETYTGLWTNGCFEQGGRRATVNATLKDCGFE